MSYKNIQFFAYVLNTGFGTNNGANVYLGLDDPAADIKARCALMQRAMDTARQSGAAGQDTLKVFMAPEFFFRGITGAYEMSHAVGNANPGPDAVSVVSALQQLASDPKWADWLFVFGSIVGKSAPEALNGKQEAYNVVLVQAGGQANAGERGARAVLKEWKSNIDFIKRPAVAPANVPAGMLYDDMVEYMSPAAASWYAENDRLNGVVGSDTQQYPYDGGGIFPSCGVTFGLEVCLDHLQGRLSGAQLPGEPQIQVQLVPSCGMDVQGGNLVIGQNGLVFGCDGLGRGASAYQVAGNALVPIKSSVTALDASDLPADDGGAAVAISSLFPVGAATGRWGVRPPLNKADAGAAAGAIVAYDPVTVPQPALVPGQIRIWVWNWQDIKVQFALLYDGAGAFQRVLCRMISATCQLNRFWYAIPDKDKVTMRGTDADGAEGTVSMRRVAGSHPFDFGIQCTADLGDFQFGGIAFEFNKQIDMTPATVGLTAA
jgi:hypothetical protein